MNSNNQNNLIVILVITIQKMFRVWTYTDDEYRVPFNAAKSTVLTTVETVYFKLIEELFPDIWKHILKLVSFMRVPNTSNQVVVSTELALQADIITNDELAIVHVALCYFSNKIYVNVQADMFFDFSVDYSLLTELQKKTLDDLAEIFLRAKGGSYTKYQHQLKFGQNRALVQYFKHKPTHLPGNPDRVIKGKVVGFFSNEKKHQVQIENDQGNSEWVDYDPDERDKFFRKAVYEDALIEITISEKIDDQARLYWAVVDAVFCD